MGRRRGCCGIRWSCGGIEMKIVVDMPWGKNLSVNDMLAAAKLAVRAVEEQEEQ